jgi:hypothetical protein
MSFLVRPDGYVGWRGASWREAGLRDHLRPCSGTRLARPSGSRPNSAAPAAGRRRNSSARGAWCGRSGWGERRISSSRHPGERRSARAMMAGRVLGVIAFAALLADLIPAAQALAVAAPPGRFCSGSRCPYGEGLGASDERSRQPVRAIPGARLCRGRDRLSPASGRPRRTPIWSASARAARCWIPCAPRGRSCRRVPPRRQQDPARYDARCETRLYRRGCRGERDRVDRSALRQRCSSR